MHYVFATYRKRHYHLFSAPNYQLAANMHRVFTQAYPGVELHCSQTLPLGWRDSRLAAYELARDCWGAGAGTVIDIRPVRKP